MGWEQTSLFNVPFARLARRSSITNHASPRPICHLSFVICHFLPHLSFAIPPARCFFDVETKPLAL
jgi:hypothetical protein